MRSLVGVLLILVVAGCGTGTARSERQPDLRTRPPITLLTGPRVDVNTGTGCWSGGCADGGEAPVEDLHAVTAASVDFRFDVEDARFEAFLAPVPEHRCQRSYSATVTDHGDGTYTLTPRAPAGRYRVGLDGEAEPGQVFGEFVWTTTQDGPASGPQAEVSVVWSPHGTLEGMGFSLNISDLPRTPRRASATITATAANGESLTFDAGRPERGCPAEGRLSFYERGDYDDSQAVAELGPAPFTYAVTLVLDGTIHRATAVWPDDHVDDPFNDNPAPVPLDFEPPLPQAG